MQNTSKNLKSADVILNRIFLCHKIVKEIIVVGLFVCLDFFVLFLVFGLILNKETISRTRCLKINCDSCFQERKKKNLAHIE